MRTPVIDTHHNALVIPQIGHFDHRAKRKGFVCGRQSLFIILLAAGQYMPLEFVIVIDTDAFYWPRAGSRRSRGGLGSANKRHEDPHKNHERDDGKAVFPYHRFSSFWHALGSNLYP